MEPPNNGHIGDECFVHYSEVVPSSEVLTCIQLLAGGTQFVYCREVVHSSVSTIGGSTVYIFSRVSHSDVRFCSSELSSDATSDCRTQTCTAQCALEYNGARKTQYLKDDIIIVRVVRVKIA